MKNGTGIIVLMLCLNRSKSHPSLNNCPNDRRFTYFRQGKTHDLVAAFDNWCTLMCAMWDIFIVLLSRRCAIRLWRSFYYSKNNLC